MQTDSKAVFIHNILAPDECPKINFSKKTISQPLSSAFFKRQSQRKPLLIFLKSHNAKRVFNLMPSLVSEINFDH
jgi:hypothetical protein